MLIKRPHITEKTLKLVEQNNQFTFEVARNASKIAAVKELTEVFGVTVTAVRSNTRLGKDKRFGRTRQTGRTADRKYMVFTLKSGDKIDLFTTK